MKSSNREEIVDHDAKGLFDIVLDIESYPYFIPWCSAMRIHSKNKNEIYADMVVWYKYCLLYTSDAADDSLRVDLGGRRIIKKKSNKNSF